MSWKVYFILFFQEDCYGWPLLKWLATVWPLPQVCFVFHFILILFASYLFLCVEYATLKARGEQSVLNFNLMIHWVPLCVSVVRTLILTRAFYWVAAHLSKFIRFFTQSKAAGGYNLFELQLTR